MLFNDQTWTAISVTIRLAAITTVLLLLIATPIALWLARGTSLWRESVAAFLSIPLVLPPTVLGFYLLIVMSPNGPLSSILPLFGIQKLAFSFEGLVIGSIVYSMPFVLQPLRNAFEATGKRPAEVASTLRASPWSVFWRVQMPLALPGFVTAAILSFAHTIGEFGVVQMIGGNIPGQTAVISTSIMEYVETDQIAEANKLALAMVIFSFIVILAVSMIQKTIRRRLS